MTRTDPPLLSVVIATYNRADIVSYAIRSVLLNAGVKLEVIVVGDGCTDNTVEAIAAVGDDRVRFVNLRQNWGEQSIPSNEGLSQARGEFIAFLNHDDLFLPWHLADLLQVHEDGADVAWSPYIVIYPGTTDSAVDCRYELAGVTPTRDYDPVGFIVASAMCFRREALERVGGWTPASQTVLSPSQDLLFKTYKAGCRIQRTDRPSVVALFSGVRKDSYVRPRSAEHQRLFELIEAGGEALCAELLRVSVHESVKRARTSSAWFALRRLHRHVSALLTRLGVHPDAPLNWLRYRRRGGFVNSVRQTTGLRAIDFRAREKQRRKVL